MFVPTFGPSTCYLYHRYSLSFISSLDDINVINVYFFLCIDWFFSSFYTNKSYSYTYLGCFYGSAQVGGVQRMLGYIRERVDGLSKQCYAYRELAGKKQQLLTSFSDLEEKVQRKEISLLSAKLSWIIYSVIIYSSVAFNICVTTQKCTSHQGEVFEGDHL